MALDYKKAFEGANDSAKHWASSFGDLCKAINEAERQIREAVRVGAGRGEEYALGALRTLRNTGVVPGFAKKDGA